MNEKSIGKFIATLRKANGYTQEELGEILGVSNKTISSWENGNSSPDLSLLPIIADLFNVTCDELMRGEKSKEERETKTNKNTIKNMYKNYYNKYLNSFYISLGLFIACVLLIVIGIIIGNSSFGDSLNNTSTVFFVILTILGIMSYLVGIFYSIINYNNAINKVSDNYHNEDYILNINKKKIFLQCLYSFFILTPFFLLINDYKILKEVENEELKNKIKTKIKFKNKFNLAGIIIILLGALSISVINSIPYQYLVPERLHISEVREREYTFKITKISDRVVQYTSYHYDNLCDVDTRNMNEGTFKFNIYFGNKDNLLEQEDFYQDGYLIDYDENEAYERLFIKLNNVPIIELSLKVTNTEKCYYTCADVEYVELLKQENFFVEQYNNPQYFYNLYIDPIIFYTLFFLMTDIVVYFVLKKKYKIV